MIFTIIFIIFYLIMAVYVWIKDNRFDEQKSKPKAFWYIIIFFFFYWVPTIMFVIAEILKYLLRFFVKK